MTKQLLTRRSMLRGVAGAAIALPALEIMTPQKASAGGLEIPNRYLVCFCGSSLGRNVPGTPGTQDLWTPNIAGPDYDLKLALEPIGELGVQSDISVVSGLETPWGPSGAVPPGGRMPMMHHSCWAALLCGVRAEEMDAIRGPTSDQIVNDAIGGHTPVSLMTYRVQAEGYGNNPFEQRMSYRRGPDGAIEMVTPKVSPQLIFQELFSGFTAPGANPEAVAAAEMLRARRLSILDLVRDSTQDLMGRLGRDDQVRLESHLDYLRDLEQRVDGFDTGAAGESCYVPLDPGDDPPIGTQSFSQEDVRSELIVEMIHLAFACDISRVGSLQFTNSQASLNMEFVTGETTSFHQIGHRADFDDPGSALTAMSLGLRWHVEQFSTLVSKLAAATEVDGSRLLDHCALTLMLEGGRGYDGATGAEESTHSTENMSALIAGGAGGMQQGRHIVKDRAHPSSVILTAMHAVGVDGPLGEVTEDIPEIFGA